MKDEAEQKAEQIMDASRDQNDRVTTAMIAAALREAQTGWLEFVRGLERAVAIIEERRKTEGYVFAEHCGILDIRDSIQAEIDKAQAGKSRGNC